jgi:PAS domain S-box-containing protein
MSQPERQGAAGAKAHGGSAGTWEESRFQKLLEAAPDAILEIDSRGAITLVNQAAERIFGYSRAELLSMNVDALVPEAVRHQHAQHRHSYGQEPRVRPMGLGLELNGQRKDGTLFSAEISLSPNRVHSELHVIALVRDISERKHTEDRLRAIREEYTAQLAQKNQELELRNLEVEKANRLKSEFMASMSHELRTPLHTIIGFSELLAEQIQGPLNDKQQRFLGHILHDSRHLLELINDVLDLSKIEAEKLALQVTSFHLAGCIDEVLDGIEQQAAARHIQVERRGIYTGTINADRLRLKEILYNLLSNAIKFTPEGGKVWAETERRGGELAITVGDTGIGIPAEEHANIFEKFYQVGNTTRGVREGTGLGLPITKRLIEMHGGRISVKSTPQVGSEFTLTLPIAGPPTRKAPDGGTAKSNSEDTGSGA